MFPARALQAAARIVHIADEDEAQSYDAALEDLCDIQNNYDSGNLDDDWRHNLLVALAREALRHQNIGLSDSNGVSSFGEKTPV